MGDEFASRTPFLFFTDHHGELADAVRNGRRNEFARFPAFSNPVVRERIPDPNAIRTFEASIPHRDRELGAEREALYQRLLRLRQSEIVPRLKDTRSSGAHAIGEKAVQASWRLGDGALLSIATNLGREPVAIEVPRGKLMFATDDGSSAELPGFCTRVWLDTDHAR